MRTVDPGRRHLLRGSMSGAVAVGLNGLGGFAFWAILARSEEAVTVGSAQRLFTALLVVTYLTTLGLPISVAKHCPDGSRRSATLFRWALLATALSSVVGATGLVLVGGDGLLAPLGVGGALRTTALATLLVVGLSCAVLVEVRLMALRHWGWVVGRVVAVVVLRFPLLAVGPDDRAQWAFLLVAGLPAISGVVGAVVLHVISPRSEPVEANDRRAWTRFSLVNYLGLLGSQGPQFLVPLVVALQVTDVEYAPFYIAWGATAIVFMVPHMLGQTLLVESSKSGAPRSALALMSLAVSMALAVVITLGSFGAGPIVSAVLGPDYRQVSTALPWLLGAAVPWSITCTALAHERSRANSRSVVLLTLLFAVAAVGATGVGVAAGGVMGAARGWFVANVLAGAASAAVLAPVVRRALGARRPEVEQRSVPERVATGVVV